MGMRLGHGRGSGIRKGREKETGVGVYDKG